MGGKTKKEEDFEDVEDDDEEEEIDVPEQVEQKIKELPTLKEKVHAIAINGYLIEKRKLDKELEKELEAEELKFRNTYKPLTDEINSIVSGTYTFSDADFQEIGELLTEQEQETKHNYFTNEKIAEYWLKVFSNSDVIGEHIEEHDEGVIKHLERIEVGKSEDLKRLWITFYFSENQWFRNDKLYKEFEMEDDVIKKSHGTPIDWKEGKNITVKLVKKKKKKGGDRKTKEVKNKSFFNFFNDIEINSDDEEEDENDENTDVEDLEQQYEIAQNIYEDLVPRSLEYYLGVIESMGDFDDDDDDDDEEGGSKKRKVKLA